MQIETIENQVPEDFPETENSEILEQYIDAASQIGTEHSLTDEETQDLTKMGIEANGNNVKINESLLNRYIKEQGERLAIDQSTKRFLMEDAYNKIREKAEMQQKTLHSKSPGKVQSKTSKLQQKQDVKEYSFVIATVNYPKEVIDNETRAKLNTIIEKHITTNKIGCEEVISKSSSGAISKNQKIVST